MTAFIENFSNAFGHLHDKIVGANPTPHTTKVAEAAKKPIANGGEAAAAAKAEPKKPETTAAQPQTGTGVRRRNPPKPEAESTTTPTPIPAPSPTPAPAPVDPAQADLINQARADLAPSSQPRSSLSLALLITGELLKRAGSAVVKTASLGKAILTSAYQNTGMGTLGSTVGGVSAYLVANPRLIRELLSYLPVRHAAVGRAIETAITTAGPILGCTSENSLMASAGGAAVGFIALKVAPAIYKQVNEYRDERNRELPASLTKYGLVKSDLTAALAHKIGNLADKKRQEAYGKALGGLKKGNLLTPVNIAAVIASKNPVALANIFVLLQAAKFPLTDLENSKAPSLLTQSAEHLENLAEALKSLKENELLKHVLTLLEGAIFTAKNPLLLAKAIIALCAGNHAGEGDHYKQILNQLQTSVSPALVTALETLQTTRTSPEALDALFASENPAALANIFLVLKKAGFLLAPVLKNKHICDRGRATAAQLEMLAGTFAIIQKNAPNKEALEIYLKAILASNKPAILAQSTAMLLIRIDLNREQFATLVKFQDELCKIVVLLERAGILDDDTYKAVLAAEDPQAEAQKRVDLETQQKTLRHVAAKVLAEEKILDAVNFEMTQRSANPERMARALVTLNGLLLNENTRAELERLDQDPRYSDPELFDECVKEIGAIELERAR